MALNQFPIRPDMGLSYTCIPDPYYSQVGWDSLASLSQIIERWAATLTSRSGRTWQCETLAFSLSLHLCILAVLTCTCTMALVSQWGSLFSGPDSFLQILLSTYTQKHGGKSQILYGMGWNINKHVAKETNTSLPAPKFAHFNHSSTVQRGSYPTLLHIHQWVSNRTPIGYQCVL